MAARNTPQTVLLVHGLVGGLDFFEPQRRMSALTVETVNLLGYGRTRDARSRGLSLASQAAHVAAAIDALPGDPVWLVGHSMGGAVAVLAAQLRRERVAGLVNVEGNLTEQDCYWSGKIARKEPEAWAASYERMSRDPEGFLVRSGITPLPQRVVWASDILAFQPAATVHAMSRALVAETLDPAYLDGLRALIDDGLSLHLVAGTRSVAGWGLPDFVRHAARTFPLLPDVGHLMIEDPGRFCRVVAGCVAAG